MKTPILISQLNKDAPDYTELLRENFKQLDLILRTNPFLTGEFQHYELILDRAVTDYKFAHHFSFIPRDIIQTFVTEGVTVTWKYDHFDRTNLQLTTTAACTLRFLVGRHEKAETL